MRPKAVKHGGEWCSGIVNADDHMYDDTRIHVRGRELPQPQETGERILLERVLRDNGYCLNRHRKQWSIGLLCRMPKNLWW
jgi:hypothetical protein